MDENASVPGAPPETVFHYTTEAGLYGIIKSQRLWATHFSYLNDSQELYSSRSHLVSVFRNELEDTFGELQRGGNIDIREGHTPQSLAELDADNFVRALYRTALNLGTPFITSFCSHAKDGNEYTDGLLSQWRGYGRDGGFALEFSTSGLVDCIELDGTENSHSGYSIGNVVYGDAAIDDDQLKKDFSSVAKIAGDLVPNILSGDPNPPDLTYSWNPFLRLISRVKNASFSEENEVRIVYIVPRGKAPPGRAPFRKLKFRDEAEVKMIPYVELFCSDNVKLPIRRVIIGPHWLAELRKSSLELFLEQEGINVEVSISRIPYMPD